MADTLHDFHNRLRVLLSIDRDELVHAGAIDAGDLTEWANFRADPFRWFVRADDETAERVWALIERRHNTGRRRAA